jgi:hypothetical protein
MKKTLIALAALATITTAETTLAESPGLSNEAQVLISQIQTDKRAIVLSTLQLTDPQVAAFTPLYDEFQADNKKVMERGIEMLNKFASNYGSMTDDAAKDILKDWFNLREDRNEVVEKYAKKMAKVLPATKVLQWVQVENKLNTLLDVQAASVIPLAQ